MVRHGMETTHKQQTRALAGSKYMDWLNSERCLYVIQARVQGGGAQGAWPPPQKLKSKKKKKKKVIRANFKLFHLYFATFSVQTIIFSSIF